MRARLVIASLCLVCLLVGISGALYGRWQHAEAEAVRQDLANANRANTALRDRLLVVPAEVLRQKEQRHAAEKAIEEDRVWAASPVPDPVVNGLCKRLSCR